MLFRVRKLVFGICLLEKISVLFDFVISYPVSIIKFSLAQHPEIVWLLVLNGKLFGENFVFNNSLLFVTIIAKTPFLVWLLEKLIV